jgi:hypothetical protein
MREKFRPAARGNPDATGHPRNVIHSRRDNWATAIARMRNDELATRTTSNRLAQAAVFQEIACRGSYRPFVNSVLRSLRLITR